MRDRPGQAAKNYPVVLYDGDCGVCNRFVEFVLATEANQSIRFAALNSPIGLEMQEAHNVPPDIDSVVLIHNGIAKVYSEAVFEVFKELKQPWKSISLLSILPRSLRDWGYRLVAANRGRSGATACRLVRPDERYRFLDLQDQMPQEGLPEGNMASSVAPEAGQNSA